MIDRLDRLTVMSDLVDNLHRLTHEIEETILNEYIRGRHKYTFNDLDDEDILKLIMAAAEQIMLKPPQTPCEGRTVVN